MTALPSLSETAKSLGPGAYLVSVVPSGLLVLSLFALIASRLYPWTSQVKVNGRPVSRGSASVAYVVSGLGATGYVVLLVAVLLAAILMRPLQLVGVQLVEGYWGSRGRQGHIEARAVERHARRLSIHVSRANESPDRGTGSTFAGVIAHSRQQDLVHRREARSRWALRSYPSSVADIMPTKLGNILRRAETTAGERYGLNTVVTYPRLYPHLSKKLDALVGNQLDIIDTCATLVLIFGVLTGAASPLIVRADWWSIVPAAAAGLTAVSYFGATNAAAEYGQYIEAAYDLHRFDMITSMHLPLRIDMNSEFLDNARLSDFLYNAEALNGTQRLQWAYRHVPPPTSANDGGETT